MNTPDHLANDDGKMKQVLHSLPRLTMPADVAERIHAALASQRPPVTAESKPPVMMKPPRRFRRLLPAFAAAAASIVVFAGLGFGIRHIATDRTDDAPTALRDTPSRAVDEPDPGAEPGTEPGTVALPPISTSGTEYTEPDLADQVRALLGRATVTDGGSSSPTAPGLATPDELAGRLADAAAIDDCIGALGLPGQLRALDYATYHDQAALIVVAQTADPGVVAVRIVGPGCSPDDTDLQATLNVRR